MNSKFLLMTFLLLAELLFTGCATSDRDRREYLQRLGPHLDQPDRPLVIVPGFGQTRLYDPQIERYVWGTQTSTLIRRFPDDLELPLVDEPWEHPVDRLVSRGYTQPEGPLDFAWKLARPLVETGGYTKGHGRGGLYLFEYDWRLGSDHNARRLDEYLAQIRKDLGDPYLKIDLVGHSLGALVVTTYLSMGTSRPEDSPDSWIESAREARAGIGHVVTIANPSGGVSEALRFLADGERFVRREISPEVVATFPVVYELIPERSDLFFDLASKSVVDAKPMSRDFWRLLGFEPDDSAADRSRKLLLQRALAIRRAHRSNPPNEILRLQIGGDCIPTLHRVLVRPDGDLVFAVSELKSSERRWQARLFEPGDGSVTRESATVHDSPAALFCDGHHGLTSDPDVHRALLRVFLEDKGKVSGPVSTAPGRND